MSTEVILHRNRMMYEVPQPVSVKTRPYDTIVQYFERQEYKPLDTMIASLDSGKYFVDPRKSYISVNVKITGTGGVSEGSFGSGSVANLFKNIRIQHKSGTQITSCQNNDVYIKARDKIEKDKFWFDTVGVQQGYVGVPGTDWNLESIIADGLQYKIKLSDLHGFFKGYNDALIPPEIADGLRIELDLNSVGQAILNNPGQPGTINNYELLKPNIQLCLVKAMDNAAINVYNTAQQKGLKWCYDDYFVSEKQYNNNVNAITLPIDKAVSVAKNCMVWSRDTPTQNSVTDDSYNFRFREFGTNWFFTLGNDLYPWKKKVSEPFDAYSICLDVFQSRYGVNIKPVEFFGTFPSGDNCNGVYAVNLLTDDYLEMSGEYINSNKRLSFEITKNTDEVGSTWATALTYTKVLIVNGTNSRIDE